MALPADDWSVVSNPRSLSTFRTFSRTTVSGNDSGKGSDASGTAVLVNGKSPRAGSDSLVSMNELPSSLHQPVHACSNGIAITTDTPLFELDVINDDIKVPDYNDDDDIKVPDYNDDDDDIKVPDYNDLYDEIADSDEEYAISEIQIDLKDGDARFGFSVVGGSDEGFSPRIDELAKSSPADKADLEVGDEILEVNGRSLENATHTEVISHIHQCIKSRTICLRVKRKTGSKLALDLAQNSNVQDAFVIAVEQQARERLEKLSALQKIKPVDMTKLSQQLSQESSGSNQDFNGLIESSPIYVTSVPSLSQSTGNIKAAVETKGLSGRPHHSSASGQRFLGVSPTTTTTTTTTNGFLAPPGTPGAEAAEHLRQQQHRQAALLSTPIDARAVVAEEEIELKQDFNFELRVASPPTGHRAPASVRSSSGRSSASTLPLKPDSDDEEEEEEDEDSSEDDAAPPRPRVPVAITNALWLTKHPYEKSLGGAGSWRKMKDASGDGGKGAYAHPPSSYHPPPQHQHREMAVDVPESFVGSSKAPPRYPNPNRTTGGSGGGSSYAESSSRSSSMSSGVARENGSLAKGLVGGGSGGSRSGTPVGKVAGNGVVVPPKPAPRTVHSPTRQVSEEIPTDSQMERIRKYQEDLRKRREEEERVEREQEFLRNSLRGSKKLQALEQSYTSQEEDSGFVNTAFELEELGDDHRRKALGESEAPPSLKRIVSAGELITALQRIQSHLRSNGHNVDDEDLTTIDSLLRNPDFQQALKIHNRVQKLWCFQTPPTPLCADAQDVVQEVLSSLHESTLPEAAELVDLLNKYEFEGLFYAHDKIAEREAVAAMSPDDELMDRASQYAENNVKVVRIEKSNEPLGATVRNEGEAVIIGRIVKGGAAEKSGLLHEGDEVLEVNCIEMRGKSVNDVCDILANMTGTLTFLVVPSQYEQTKTPSHDTVMHVKAHFDYDPEDDMYIPCRELGISFLKGDILHVINQEDPNWWQAYREGEEDQTLAGLIPSKSFQQQREAMKQTIVGDGNNREKSKKGTLLCAKKNTKKKKKKVLYNANYNDDFDAEEILTYEEVTLYYPRANRKRPIVLIGPPNIGRHEVRQKLMEDVERFSAAVPHTSRPKNDEELDGQDYYFITRQQFEGDIVSRKFVEHGEYEKNYYGTSLDAIRTVVNSGKICVLNLHPQSLKILKASDLKPYVVYIAPPSLDKLRQNQAKMGTTVKDDELKDTIEKAREMEESYGHYFDLVIVNSDLERAYNQLLHKINILEREPQWVPAAWLQNEIN